MQKNDSGGENVIKSEVMKEVGEHKELFGIHPKEVIETNHEVRERMERCGVSEVALEGVKERYQIKIAESLEEMTNHYPELREYLGRIRTADLPHGVFACAGPICKENGFQAEIQLSRESFTKGGLECRLVDMEKKNWRDESWLAGEGLEGVLKHEMAHVLHLRMIAEKEGVEPGCMDKSKYKEITEQYQRNAIVTNMCYNSFKDLGISAKDIGKELSTYGAHNFGEFFAEAISEYETKKNPRRLAYEVHRRYQEYIEKGGKES